MEQIITNLILAIISFILAATFVFISKYTKNLFKEWTTKDKSVTLNVCIFVACALGAISSISKNAEKIALPIGVVVVIFIIILATNIAANKEK